MGEIGHCSIRHLQLFALEQADKRAELADRGPEVMSQRSTEGVNRLFGLLAAPQCVLQAQRHFEQPSGVVGKAPEIRREQVIG